MRCRPPLGSPFGSRRNNAHPLALPLGELSPQVTERAWRPSTNTLSVFAALSHLSQREKQGGRGTAKQQRIPPRRFLFHAPRSFSEGRGRWHRRDPERGTLAAPPHEITFRHPLDQSSSGVPVCFSNGRIVSFEAPPVRFFYGNINIPKCLFFVTTSHSNPCSPHLSFPTIRTFGIRQENVFDPALHRRGVICFECHNQDPPHDQIALIIRVFAIREQIPRIRKPID